MMKVEMEKVEVNNIDHLSVVKGRPDELWTVITRTRSGHLVLKNIMTGKNQQFPRDKVTVLSHVEIYVKGDDGERDTLSVAVAFDNLYRHFFPDDEDMPDFSRDSATTEELMSIAAPGHTNEFKPYHFDKLWNWFNTFVEYLHDGMDEEE